jgi:ketosteroid isomerase-like protein
MHFLDATPSAIQAPIDGGPMSTEENKTKVREIYDALADGDASVFARHVHPDYVWRLSGHCSWSRDYVGQEAIRQQLIGPLFMTFRTPYKAVLKSIAAEGDVVIAEVEGDATTKGGMRYNNLYCFIFRFRDGLIEMVTEYCDTDFVERVLGPYQHALMQGHAPARDSAS